MYRVLECLKQVAISKIRQPIYSIYKYLLVGAVLVIYLIVLNIMNTLCASLSDSKTVSEVEPRCPRASIVQIAILRQVWTVRGQQTIVRNSFRDRMFRCEHAWEDRGGPVASARQLCTFSVI